MSLSSLGDEEFLEVAMRHRLGALRLDVTFAVSKAWTVLFGASGSGKTTVLRAIAGLMRPESGRIAMRGDGGERVLFDSRERIFLPPHRRTVRMGTQAAALFPHRTVRENVGYGAASMGGGAAVDEALRCLGLMERAEAMPAELSGGQGQRVSLARAVVAAAGLGVGGILLLDEPFTGLGMAERDAMVAAVKTYLAGTGTKVISVTHDVGEAFLLGAEVIRIGEGRVMEQGPAEVVLGMERERLLGQLGG